MSFEKSNSMPAIPKGSNPTSPGNEPSRFFGTGANGMDLEFADRARDWLRLLSLLEGAKAEVEAMAESKVRQWNLIVEWLNMIVRG
eukprot:CAMPEP_0171469700 /NCGR_PEP_ID=MMETSP0945-20130129/11448_1 /TAXON_ID=109269 /ORGANISM="Vaucheria litorea, Strain CCMP2940" /LENGTH=85 /DNA_ID=CAMNT_0011998909 /DNA_START=156 /DNA_END=413 /DNA_ORIENTATION=+